MRLGSLGAMPMPMRPRPCATVGRPWPTCFQVAPSSVDLNKPLPGTPLSALWPVHGACRVAHSTAYTVCGSAGSSATCTAPTSGFLYSTCWKDLPPSAERYTPRSVFGPYGWPSTATNNLFSSCGSTTIEAICWPSRKPRCCQVLPASVDLYMPSPVDRSGRIRPSPEPTYMTLGLDLATARSPTELLSSPLNSGSQVRPKFSDFHTPPLFTP